MQDDCNVNIARDLKTKFWSTYHKIFEGAAQHLPSFDVTACYRYFHDTLSQTEANRKFVTPEWVTKLSPPLTNFTIQCPTYRDVAKAVNRCKPGASGCPIDQLSVLILKNCPIIRTILTHIIAECWSTCHVPACWTVGATVLIYKKGGTDDPSNFRPITLQPVWYKIFSSIYASKLQAFVKFNNFLDGNRQKGFCSGVDGVTEHNELLAHMMQDAKRKQHSISVTLLDLQNAFGSVHHNLIRASLQYHHVPSIFSNLFEKIYDNAYITVSVQKQWIDPVRVERGVLQGDPSSPLLFNLCFNSLMLTLNEPVYRKLGYSWGPENSNRQRAWLQYADHAAITASDNKNAQRLLNVFEAWCTWSTMIIRRDKCSTFGMQKKNNKYCQILPNLSLDNQQVPHIAINGEYKYLGRIFNFSMDNATAKTALEQKLTRMLIVTSGLKISAQTKLKILSTYIHSQLLFPIRTYDLTSTWVEQTLQAICIRFIRDWLEMPISACVTEMLELPKSQGGLGIKTFKHLAEKNESH